MSRRRDHRDVVIESLADDVVSADHRILETLLESEAYRQLSLAAIGQLHEARRTIAARDATIAALRDELRREHDQHCRLRETNVRRGAA
jgi:hypothetical protein